MNPAEARQRAAELEAEVAAEDLGDEDHRGAAAYLAARGVDVTLFRQGMICETGDGARSVELLWRAVQIVEDERGSPVRRFAAPATARCSAGYAKSISWAEHPVVSCSPHLV